jgi:hypothetical protein
VSDEAKHTPGPWRLEKLRANQHYASVLAPNDGLVVQISMESHDDVEWIQNAFLIAAAPDLLEACQSARFELGRPDYLTTAKRLRLIEELNKAIAKAEGTNR